MILVIDDAPTAMRHRLGDAVRSWMARRGRSARGRRGPVVTARRDPAARDSCRSPAARRRRSGPEGVIVGTGPAPSPGCASGSRRAKGLAHALGVPIVGVSTGEALLAAASGPAWPCCCSPPARTIASWSAGAPERLAGGVDRGVRRRDASSPSISTAAPGRAVAAGERRDGLAAALLRLGARLAAGCARRPRRPRARVRDAAARRPRASGEVAWSRDPR
jgi:hypothetical protein